MKNLIVIALAFVFAVPVMAQKKKKDEEVQIEVPALPYCEETSLISYTGVEQATGTSVELYAKALAWMKSYYKNPSEVIRTKDEASGKLEGKARFRIWDEAPDGSTKTQAGNVEYDIYIMCKDGRYKYEVTKIGQKQATFFPAEKWDTANKAEYKRNYASYLVQVDTEMQTLVKSLKEAMGASGSSGGGDDW